MVAEADVLPAGTSSRVDEAWAAIQHGARNAVSIGFLPIEFDSDQPRKGQTGVTFRRVELLEISSVTLPSCPTCLVESKAWHGGNPESVLVLSDADDSVLELSDWDASRQKLTDTIRDATAAGLESGLYGQLRPRAEEVVLEIVGWPGPQTVCHTRRAPGPETYDIDPRDLADAVRSGIRREVAGLVRREVARARARLRGRVDFECDGTTHPTFS